MLSIVVIIFLAASILLILVSLLKDPSDEALGRMFGGSNTKGYTKTHMDPVEKLMRALSIAFVISCLALVFVLNSAPDSILDSESTTNSNELSAPVEQVKEAPKQEAKDSQK